MRGATSAASRPIVTSSSSMRATERPSAWTSRTMICSPPSPLIRRSTRNRSSPVRIAPASARAPRASARASTMRLFPAPVSPVRTVRPGPNSTRTASMMASPATPSSRICEPPAALPFAALTFAALTAEGGQPSGAQGPRRVRVRRVLRIGSAPPPPQPSHDRRVRAARRSNHQWRSPPPLLRLRCR